MRAAAYARYSTDQQTDNSIATQLAGITQYCRQHGHEIVAVFTDEARSGTNTEREGFQNLLAAAAKKQFECVIIYDVTRGSRDVADWFTFRKLMRELRITILSVTEQLGDISDPNTFLLELINIGIGQHQVLQTRQKSIAGKVQKAKEGVFLGGFAPLGYDIIDRKYVINEREAEAVRLIFQLYGAGRSYDHILDRVNELGITGKRGRPIGKNSLNSILNNDRYIGVYSWNRHNNRHMKKWCGGKETPELATEITDGIPAIVDADTWNRVHARMCDRKRNAVNGAKNKYMLSGKITCINCGGGYFGKTNTNTRGVKTRYYTCGNKTRTKQCDAWNLNAEMLEKIVCEKLKDWLDNLDYDKLAEAILPDIAAKASIKYGEARQQLIDIISGDISNILRLLEISDADQRATLIKQLAELENRRAELQREKPKMTPDEATKEKIIEKIKKDVAAAADTDMERLVKEYIQKIYAYSDSIEIEIGVTINGSPSRI